MQSSAISLLFKQEDKKAPQNLSSNSAEGEFLVAQYISSSTYSKHTF